MWTLKVFIVDEERNPQDLHVNLFDQMQKKPLGS